MLLNLIVFVAKDEAYSKSRGSTSTREINITKKRKVRRFFDGQRHPVKVIRMADYFKPSSAATMSALNMSAATTADEKASSQREISQMQLSEFETQAAQEQKMREELDRKLE